MKNLLLLLTLLSTITLSAQEIFKPPVDLPGIKAVPATGNISIDGRLDESDWTAAEAISNFVQVEPRQGEPSANPTFVKALFTKSHLYIGVFCSDSLGKAAIRVPDMMRDFNWRAHDTFAIAIDGFNDKRNSMTFVTNPYGAQKDYLSFDDVFFDSDWNGLWRVRTSITDHGWYAEFEIPWKTLRYAQPHESENLWNINFLRL
ncbi:MAG: carbohydrate binding family 9 domain-containing protein, partial [Cyclobacteriaceae bacterium]|nr:carbohydrate binding family 9 domain-containing protein [Cyclobacteriaceae bacterium]